MNVTALKTIETSTVSGDWRERARSIGEAFADRAFEYDQKGEFVSDNYRDLRRNGFFSAAIPVELGGGGATYEELSGVIRELGHNCGSTALSFSMHTHPVAANVYRHLRGDETATKSLRKIANDDLIIAGTGANDWLESSGEAKRVEGGYLVNALKRFVSGAPGAHLFVTSVTYSGPQGSEVIHFAIPFQSKGIRIVETWNALGMRGTGSHDVVLDSVFVADDTVVARRPAGVWHPMWNVILPTAMPLICSAYVGIAEKSAELAIEAAKYRKAELAPAVGDMLNSLATAQIALDDMVRLNANHGFSPTTDIASAILTRKTIVADAARNTVELAAELVGGPGFSRGHPIERNVRDVRAIHFHPLPSRRQHILSGRIALGFDPVAARQ